MNKIRSNALIIFFSGVFTFGITNSIFIGIISSEFLYFDNNKLVYPIKEAVLNFITLGVYGFIWAYKISKCIDKRDGVNSGFTPIILFLPFVRSIGVAYLYYKSSTEVSA